MEKSEPVSIKGYEDKPLITIRVKPGNSAFDAVAAYEQLSHLHECIGLTSVPKPTATELESRKLKQGMDSHSHREVTITPPEIQPDAVAHLRLSRPPKDPSYGWIIGRDPSVCDIVLQDRTVSGKHFAITWDWEERTFSIHSISALVLSIRLPGGNMRELGENEQQWLPASGLTRISFSRFFRIFIGVSGDVVEDGFVKPLIWKLAKRRFRQEISMNRLKLDKLSDTFPGVSASSPDDYVKGIKLGQGLTATVWAVNERHLGAAYAIKVFNNHYSGTREFLKEARTMERLSHAHVVKMFHQWPNQLLLEKLSGTLRTAHSISPLSAVQVRSVVQQCVEACQYLHSRKFLHRDIKPENILYSTLDPIFVKLADLGFARSLETSEARTFCGTMMWKAPEVTSSCLPYDEKVDIYSLGCVALYYVADPPASTPLHTFEADGTLTSSWLSGKLRSDVVPRLSRPGSSPFAQLLARMLQHSSRARPSAAACLQSTCLQPATLSSEQAVWFVAPDAADSIGKDALFGEVTPSLLEGLVDGTDDNGTAAAHTSSSISQSVDSESTEISEQESEYDCVGEDNIGQYPLSNESKSFSTVIKDHSTSTDSTSTERDRKLPPSSEETGFAGTAQAAIAGIIARRRLTGPRSAPSTASSIAKDSSSSTIRQDRPTARMRASKRRKA